jgi:hypothetical protein
VSATAGLGRPVQIAYAVPDALEYAHRWVEQFGAGPFFVRPHIHVEQVTHRGAPSVFDHTSAYGQWGDIMVELVQDHGTGPSAVRDMYAADETGIHHMAFFVDDIDATTAALNAAGHPTAMTASTRSGLRFHFVDTSAELGHMVELYERSPHLAAFYQQVADAAQDWDGSDPVRMIG